MGNEANPGERPHPAPHKLRRDRQVWERQPDETEEEWHRFKVWRDIKGPRTVKAVREGTGITAETIKKNRISWRWDERAREFDRHMDLIEITERRRYLRQMVADDSAAARRIKKALLVPTEEILLRIEEGTLGMSKIPTPTLLRMIGQLAGPYRDVVAVDRVANGIPGNVDALAVVKETGGASAPTTLADVAKDVTRKVAEAMGVTIDEVDDDVVDAEIVHRAAGDDGPFPPGAIRDPAKSAGLVLALPDHDEGE